MEGTYKCEKCGQKIKRKDKNRHDRECTGAFVVCPKCSAEMTREKFATHNCFSDLREMITELANENRQLKS